MFAETSTRVKSLSLTAATLFSPPAGSCIDQCFIADSMLEELPAPSSVGKTKVGGIDLHKARMRWAVEALIALSTTIGQNLVFLRGFSGNSFASLINRARARRRARKSSWGWLLSNQAESDYGPDARPMT